MRKQSPACAVAYFIFVILAGITMMKILTGMLCKVIVAVADTEHEKIHVSFVKEELLHVMVELNCVELPQSGDVNEIDTQTTHITKELFGQMIVNSRALASFHKIGVDFGGLVAHASYFYEHASVQQPAMKFADFLETLLQLRGTNNATVRDIVGVKKLLRDEVREVKDHMSKVTNVRFLPITIDGIRVLKLVGIDAYRADNTVLKAPTTGLMYCLSKDVEDKDELLTLAWGGTIHGSSDGDGWVKVEHEKNRKKGLASSEVNFYDVLGQLELPSNVPQTKPVTSKPATPPEVFDQFKALNASERAEFMLLLSENI